MYVCVHVCVCTCVCVLVYLHVLLEHFLFSFLVPFFFHFANKSFALFYVQSSADCVCLSVCLSVCVCVGCGAGRHFKHSSYIVYIYIYIENICCVCLGQAVLLFALRCSSLLPSFPSLILLDARLQKTIEYASLCHHIHRAGSQRILLLHLRLSRPQQCGAKDHGQIMQRHLIVGLLFVHPASERERRS